MLRKHDQDTGGHCPCLVQGEEHHIGQDDPIAGHCERTRHKAEGLLAILSKYRHLLIGKVMIH